MFGAKHKTSIRIESFAGCAVLGQVLSEGILNSKHFIQMTSPSFLSHNRQLKTLKNMASIPKNVQHPLDNYRNTMIN